MPLTPEQLDALRAVPLGTAPNKLRLALALLNGPKHSRTSPKVRQLDVAEHTGIAAPNLSRLFTGDYQTLTIDTAQSLADYFGCQIEDLFPSRRPSAVAS
jgi:DNA-binding Xre family transcriptional regulator